jgi:hypothetical protein
LGRVNWRGKTGKAAGQSHDDLLPVLALVCETRLFTAAQLLYLLLLVLATLLSSSSSDNAILSIVTILQALYFCPNVVQIIPFPSISQVYL